MLYCFILSKSRFMRVKKLYFNREIGTFNFRGFEYNIDRKKIYTKRKPLGIGSVFWCMYLEGNPNPIEFDDAGYNVSGSDVPIDEIALIINKILNNKINIVMLIIVGFNIVLTTMIIMKVYS